MEKIAKCLAAIAMFISTLATADVASTTPMQTIKVGRAQLDVPSALKWRVENEARGILMGEHPSTGVIMSVVLSTVEKDGKLISDAGSYIAAQQGMASGATLQKNGAWYKTEGPPPKAKQGAAIHDWYYGSGAHNAVISCVVDISAIDSDVARAILDSVPKMMSSLRTAP